MSKNSKSGYQFGTFQGVFIPSILTILGVIMYLRFGWVLGNLGLVQTLVVVTLATSITFLTALSISGLATNMKIGGGGAYYIISRSLGVEAGAAIGLPLFFAQALGITFYIAGFSEAVSGLFPGVPHQVIGLITVAVLFVVVLVSADLALKMQLLIFTLIVLSLISFFTGGYAAEPLALDTDIPAKLAFWPVFAVFFPAVTGIEAGLSMSGDLKAPEKALPYGTLAAVLVSYAVYMCIPFYLHALAIPDADLLTNSLIMKDVARWGKFILFGVWSAALSSAMGALLGSPRTLQALARDGVVPRWIGRGYGKKNDPHMATVLSLLIATAGILLGNLNVIAPILTMFFLTSYGLLNFSAGMAGLLNNPSWRPKFKVHWAFSMLGAVGCLFVMVMINPGATFAATLFCGLVYYLMQKRSMSAYWGDLRYGIYMLVIRVLLYGLTKLAPHENTWRPNILVLSGSPSTRWYLIALADAISHGKGFLTVASIVPADLLDGARIQEMQATIQKYLEDRDVPALVKIVPSANVIDGAKGLIQNYGFGALLPNTVLLGDIEEDLDYVSYSSFILVNAKSHRNLVIVREIEGAPPQEKGAAIHLWWRGGGDNCGLMLALARQLKTSQEWDGSVLHIKTIVDADGDKGKQTERLAAFVSEANIGAEIEVHVLDGQDPYALILEQSAGADIVFMGMRKPEDEETAEAYGEYYRNLMSRTKGMPTTVMVLASENINFNRIFASKK